MSPVAKTIGKEFEETFKPKKGVPDKLTDDKNESGKKGKKDKKKKKSKLLRILIILMLIIVLIAGAGAALYFTGNLAPLLSKVGLHLPTLTTAPSASITQRVEALDKRQAELDAREETLNKLQDKLDKQKKQIEAAQATPTVETTTFSGIRAAFSEEKLTELQQVGTIYSKMEPASAASIMTKIYDSKQIAIIIYYMQPATSAIVLAKLDPVLAAEVTKILTS